jgi:hypothetical protein
MEALASVKEVGEAIPAWLLSLEDLLGKISTRQMELAQLSDFHNVVRPMRPQGSTESLRHADGNVMKIDSPVVEEHSSPSPIAIQADSKPPGVSSTAVPDNGGLGLSGEQRQYLAQQMRRKRKTGSMLSGASGTPKYRTRSMIIVYYDSAVQEAFEGLVRNISSSRNNIRKGKMAARMNALAASVNSKAEKPFAGMSGPGIPKLSYARSSRTRPGETKTVYDIIDAGLEFSQSTCETAAHQFLRDGDCATEISNIRERLNEVMKLAQDEVSKLEVMAAEAAENAKGEEVTETDSKSNESPKQEDIPTGDHHLPPAPGLIEVDSDEG